MRTCSLVVLALWFFTLCLKPVQAAGSGTLEVIIHKSDAVHGISKKFTCDLGLAIAIWLDWHFNDCPQT